jgi:hypothetical protein
VQLLYASACLLLVSVQDVSAEPRREAGYHRAGGGSNAALGTPPYTGEGGFDVEVGFTSPVGETPTLGNEVLENPPR